MQDSPLKQVPYTFMFHRKSDGRYSVKSDDVPGLFLASKDLPALWRDLEVSIRDLLYFNKDLLVDAITWKPSQAEAQAKVAELKPAQPTEDITETCMVTLKAA